jgi:small multidrug resistance family-3 protein
MPTGAALLLLCLSAVLEAGGDALVRIGLHGARGLALRVVLMALGALVLFAYGVAVNLPPWDFGRLLGVYVALFFVVAQVINRVAFGVSPTPAILVGGALIIGGALVMTFWHPGG